MKPSILFPAIFFLVTLCQTGIHAFAGDLPDLNQMKILNLKTAGRIAIANNPSLAAAHSRIKQAKHRLEQASALYWPRMNAGVSYARTDLAENTYQTNLASARLFNPSATINNPEDYYTAGIQAIWVLFDGFERKYVNAAARYGKEQSEFQMDDMKRLLLTSVAQTYFMAQLSAENINISMADQDFNQRLLEEAEARIQKGAGSLSDKLNFKIRVNAAKAGLLHHQKAYQSTLHALSAMMGMPDADFPEHLKLDILNPDSRDDIPALHTDKLIQYALENRHDLLGYTSALKASESEIEIARSDFYPSVNLSASLDGNRTGDASFDSDDIGSSVGASVSYNFFSGGADSAKLKEAKEKNIENKKNMEAARINIIKDVRQAIEDVNLAQKELDLQRANVDLVQKNRDLVEKEYAAGQSSLVRLNEAQRDLIEARSRLASSLVSLRMARFDLESATGSIVNQFAE